MCDYSDVKELLEGKNQNVCMDIEKFKERSHPPLPSYSLSDNFDSFLQTAISAILAFVVSLRIFLLATFKRIKSQPEEDLDQPELHIIEESSSSEDSKMSKKQHSNGMPSVMSLLQTDEMPSSCSDDEPTTSEHIPLPSLLQSNMNSLPNFLHTINEEESDELRSLTGSSLASPRTIVENRRLSNISLHSQTSDINQSREQLDKNSQTISIESETKAEELSSDQVKGEKEEAEEEEEEDRFELLKKLANIKKPIETEMTSGHEGIVEPSSTSETIEIERKSKEVRPCSPIQVRLAEQEHIDDVDETQVPEESSDNESEHLEIMRRVVESSEDKPQLAEIVTVQHELADADRDQDEELVFNDERRKTVTMDDSSSLRSASINLESQKGEIDLNESFASNPTDETVLMQQTKDQMDSSSRPQSPLDLPPPPPSVIQAPVHPPVPPPPPPKPNVNIGETTKTWTKSSEPDAKIPVSSLSPAQPPPSILSTTSTSSRTVISNTYPLYTSSTASMSVPTEAPPPPPAPQTGSSYQPHYSSASALNQATSSIGIGSTAPKSISSSREDLLSEHATSRSTVREIPVQRAPSTAPSHTTSVLDYRVMPTTTTSYQHVETPSDEYYRREVMTRTIITRSTEALSQTPIGRSVSPIDRYLPYTTTTTAPDGRTREERTVDYKVTYHRDIEEEERRVREEQARRRQLEQERRTREEESRRIWEQRQREELQRLYNQQAMTERELERSLAERERAEKDRIEKDRLDRQKAEMIRRAEWERLENERIAAEEAELARRRALEKERIEREKAEEERRTLERLQKEKERLEREREEAERKERERLERERIERERIERERIEIERIERIKRERLERERREREKEKEEEERLKREREELERIERERRELEIRERQEYELQRREAEDRERQRLEDEAREMRRREEERREAELLAEVRRQAEERERARKRQEREEAERIERIRLEQQRIDMERAEAERRERERREEERREMELLEAARRKKEMRERERLEEMERERQREEEERRERERREQERYLAAERERQRRQEEEEELARLNELQRAAAQRQAQRDAELERQRERDELDRKARQLSEMEMREKERRERERLQEEAQLAELQEKERRNQEIRDRERREAADREANRQREDRRSRDKLDILVRERSEKEKFEAEKRRLLAEKEAMNKKRNHLLSHETLAKLTQPLYYTSKEPEVTTKVERQVIERIDRNLWVEDMPSSAQTAIGYLDNDENNRDRMYNPNDLGRSGSSRYHRAKMDKARRDFYSSSQDSAELQNDKFRKSIEDISSTRSRQDYRGPLLQKFHESEFRTTTYNDTDGLPYRRMGPSPYEQPFAKLLEETERKYALYNSRASNPGLYQSSRTHSSHYLDQRNPLRVQNETNTRAESVVAYGRESRRDSPTEASHARSRSADYLMDRKIREETAVPENQLQKSCGGDHSPRESRISEYEMRFRKSTEKLTVPDWYRENKPQATTTTGTTTKSSYRQNEQSQQPTLLTTTTTSTPSAQTVDFTRGMFDKYRDEIEDLRRSRSSLHHTGMEQPQQQNTRQNPSSSLSGIEQTFSHSGYTVSEVPNGWNLQTSQSSRVIEVADTFIGGSLASHEYGNISNRYGGRVTIEEVLDVFFQKAVPRDPYVPIDKSYPQADEVYQGNLDVPCIYTNNNLIMRQVLNHPEKAEHILRNEELYVRCTQCHRTRSLPSARLYFVSCKHCYTYYCSRQCRRQNWSQHSTRCSFARINTLCKDVIMKVREDEDAQAYMSKVAREGFSSGGRGSVNIRLSSPQIAQAYVTNGWRALNAIPLDQLLYYYTIAALEQEKKEPSLIALCRRYEPHEKFILSVSIIADIEHCPETPPPETRELSAPRFESVRNPPFFSNIAHEV